MRWLRCPCCFTPLDENEICAECHGSICTSYGNGATHRWNAYRQWEKLHGLAALPPEPLHIRKADISLLLEEQREWEEKWGTENRRRWKLFWRWEEEEKWKYWTWQRYKKDKKYLEFKSKHPERTHEEALRLYEVLTKEWEEKELAAWRQKREPIVRYAKVVAQISAETISEYALGEDTESQSRMNTQGITTAYFCWKTRDEAASIKGTLRVTVGVEILGGEDEAREKFSNGTLDCFRIMFHQGIPLDVESWLLSKESFRGGSLKNFRQKFPKIPNVITDVHIGEACLALKSYEPRLSPLNINYISFYRGRIIISIEAGYSAPKSITSPHEGLGQPSFDNFIQTTLRIARDIDANIIGYGL